MYFCLQCVVGKENEAVTLCKKIIKESPCSSFNSDVWFPSKEVSEKRRGTFRTVERTLFPGYVFIRWDGDNEPEFPFDLIKKLPQVYKVLAYSNGRKSLIGNDLKYAMWIDENSGFITQSKVLFTKGQKIHIVQGPLVGFDGNVVKVDKHHKRITLQFNIGDIPSEVSFSVEFLEQNITVSNLSEN